MEKECDKSNNIFLIIIEKIVPQNKKADAFFLPGMSRTMTFLCELWVFIIAFGKMC